MRAFSRFLFGSFAVLVGMMGSMSIAHAASKTICAAGCDYTSIGEAFSGDGAAGEEYVVQGGGGSPYDPSVEGWNISFPNASSTLRCTGGAVIGQTNPAGSNRLYMTTDSTVRDCSFNNITLATASDFGGGTPSNINILNNTFSSATGTVLFASGGTNFSIKDNTNIHLIYLQSTTTLGVIENNTFYGDNRLALSASMFVTDATTTNVQILSNTFTNRSSSVNGGQGLISLRGDSFTFATNTVRYAVEVSDSSLESSVVVSASGTNYIGGNFIDGPTESATCYGLNMYEQADAPAIDTYIIRHNTIRSHRGICASGAAAHFSILNDRSDIEAQLYIDYNIFYNASSTVSTNSGFMIEHRPTNVFSQSNTYNGAYHFTGGAVNLNDGSGGGDADVSDATSLSSDPMLQIRDADTSNDLVPAPFSAYLDVNASEDVGATSASRRSTMTLSQSGTIDYSTVDATTTADIPSFLRSGDTVTIATGTYPAFNINSSYATTSVTIQGVGSGTVIDAGGGSSGIVFTNVSSSNISNLVVQNASGVEASTYAITKILGHVGSQDYNEGFAMIGLASGHMAVLTSASSCPSGFPFIDVGTDGVDITSVTAAGTSNFHLAAVNIMGSSHITLLLPSSLFANQTALDTYFSGVCGLPGAMYTIDAFADNAFTVSGGTYTYDASSLASASMTFVAGVTDPPTITTTLGTPYAGIKLAGSTNHISISSVTSTSGGYGILFATTANGYNTLSDSVLTGNAYYDVVSASNATNTLDNVSFTRASSSVSGAGPLLVKYDARVRLVRQGGSAISGGAASSTSADSTVTSFGSTNGSGYTSYVSLAAHTIDSLSSDLTNGGYNPYTINGLGTDYFSSSTSVTLSSPNQTITLVMHSSVAPQAPTTATTTSLGTTSSTFAWTDHSDDETAFLVDYRASGRGQSYPGTTFLVSTGTSAVVSGLTPGEVYEFRVAAVNTNGTSTYATSSEFTLSATTPAAPTVTVLSSTSLSVGIDTNGNATSVEYTLYSAAVGGYLNSSGSVVSTASWNTSSTWGTLTISNLTCNTSYSFLVTARNALSVETATSSASTVTTSACASSGGGGGGGGGGSIGGGGGVGGIGFLLPGTVVPVPTSSLPLTPSPTSSSHIIPVVPTSSMVLLEVQPLAPPTPDLGSRERLLQALGINRNLEAEDRSLPLVRQDAREFNVSLSDTQANRLALFIAYGASPETRRLGEGERRALVRDMLETMQRADLSAEDMQRLTVGEIPRMRNLAVERQQLPRVRQTFRTLFGHDPNFRNPQENLAWNGLMYRIRFTRNLSLEQQGIREFRATFGRSPSTPFQWATVRVQGYVQR